MFNNPYYYNLFKSRKYKHYISAKKDGFFYLFLLLEAMTKLAVYNQELDKYIVKADELIIETIIELNDSIIDAGCFKNALKIMIEKKIIEKIDKEFIYNDAVDAFLHESHTPNDMRVHSACAREEE